MCSFFHQTPPWTKCLEGVYAMATEQKWCQHEVREASGTANRQRACRVYEYVYLKDGATGTMKASSKFTEDVSSKRKKSEIISVKPVLELFIFSTRNKARIHLTFDEGHTAGAFTPAPFIPFCCYRRGVAAGGRRRVW